jgi:hypothetical protein
MFGRSSSIIIALALAVLAVLSAPAAAFMTPPATKTPQLTSTNPANNLASWRRPVSTLEWDNAKAQPVGAASPLLALTTLALATIRAPIAVAATAGVSYSIASSVTALRSTPPERLFFLGSLLAVVAIGVAGGISFGSALCAFASVVGLDLGGAPRRRRRYVTDRACAVAFTTRGLSLFIASIL